MKKTNAFRALAIWLVSLCFICLFADPRVRADSTVKFKLIQNRWIVASVLVSGQGPFDFLLDTGTNVTVITPELAQQLAIRPKARVSLITVAGSQVVPYSLLPSLSLGPKTVENLEVIYSDLSEIHSLHPRICGVLGQNFLSQFNYTLNYRDRLIEFGEGQHKNHPLGSSLRFQQREGRLIIVALSTSSKKKVLKLVLDSGISRLIIFETTSQPLELDVEQSENQWVTGSTTVGSRNMRTAYLRTLQIGGARFSNLPVALVEAPGAEDHFGDGLLPTSLFSSIFFNNKEGYVILNERTSQ
jgi:predicted aspartyl protease